MSLVIRASLTATAPLPMARRDLAIRCCKAGQHEGVEHADTGRQILLRNRYCRQGQGCGAFLEGLPRGLGRLIGGGAAMHQRGCFGGEDLLCLVDLVALECGKARNLIRAARR